MSLLKSLNSMFLAPVMLGVLFFTGIFYLIRLRMKPVFCLKTVALTLVRKPEKGGTSPFKAMTVALAGTLGVGNIVGVATAIRSGGAGSVFWMIFSAMVAMIIKYAEVVLAMLYRTKQNGEYHGGAAYYIKNGLGKSGLAAFFCVLCISASFTIGNIIQINAVSSAFASELGVPPVITGIAVAVAAFFIVYKGFHRISDFTVMLIPFLSVAYILVSLIIIVYNFNALPGIFSDIMRLAFTPDAAVGGILGFLLSRGVRYGITRGIGSNEAGCGTAPTAHAKSDNKSAVEQGFFGIFEVFCDTVVLCTLTALVILIYIDKIDGDGMVLALKAYEMFFGGAAGYIMTFAILCFAFSTIITWAYYAKESIRFLSTRKAYAVLFVIAYCCVTAVGAVLPLNFIWELADFTISLMTVINCLCLLPLSGQVAQITKNYFQRI